ncbi:hypothetical protein ATANTOWER_010293 [Ataeniobius toweri]|uniref:Secreted protein n=1 Tax=Ataeniobius toweri TaxID=208326 RepID=A0ABU7BPQ6_9TELE|nr:hypothetical protein [Ataeniobius toweri]
MHQIVMILKVKEMNFLGCLCFYILQQSDQFYAVLFYDGSNIHIRNFTEMLRQHHLWTQQCPLQHTAGRTSHSLDGGDVYITTHTHHSVQHTHTETHMHRCSSGNPERAGAL